MADLSRLKAQLLISGLQKEKPALFQVIDQLIRSVEAIQLNLTAAITTISGGTTNVINNLVSLNLAEDSVAEDPLIIPGLRGLQGEVGPPGSVLFLEDSIDPDVIGPIKGEPGNPGPIGATGQPGPPIVIEDWVEPDFFPPMQGPSGNPGPTGATGALGPVFLVEDGLQGEDGFSIPSASGSSNIAITTDVFTSRPAAGNDGNLFLPTNGFTIDRDNGVTWQPWGPIFAFTTPIDGDFVWINQGTASVNADKNAIFLLAGNSALNIRKKSKPFTKFHVSIALFPRLLSVNFNTCGLLFRESGSGKVHTFTLEGNSSGTKNLYSQKWNSPTSFSANYTNIGIAWLGPFFFIRITDDGTNRICSYSSDGQNWATFHSVGRTDFLTADEVGFFVNGSTAAMTLLSWQETEIP